MSDCIFCKIVAKSVSASIVYEDESAIVFEDIHPKANTHFLIIPKKHLASIIDAEEADQDLLGHLLIVCQNVAKKQNLPGYNIQINVGELGGQEVFHLHLHLMSKF